MSTTKMKKIYKKYLDKYIAKQSESVTSYLTCFSNEDEHESTVQYNKMHTATRKSGLYIKDVCCKSDDDIHFKQNRVRLKPNIKHVPSSHSVSTKTLCVVSRKRKKFQKPTTGTCSEELAPTRYASRTSCNKTSTKRYFSSTSLTKPYRNENQFIVRSFTQCTTVLESSRRPLQGSNKTKSITNKYYNEFCKTSSNLVEDKKSSSDRQFRDAYVSRQNNEDQSVDMSLKLKTIINANIYSESEEETHVFRQGRMNRWLFELNKVESHSYDKSVSVDELRNRSNSFTYNTMNKEDHTEKFDYTLMKHSLLNSTSAVKKFDILQSLLMRLANQDSLERLQTVQAIIDEDLFSVKQKSGCEIAIKNLLWPLNVRTPHPLQTSTAKLLNALVSYQIGRAYFHKMSLIKLLTWSESELKSESLADNLMAVMMKLSLSQFHRCDMLEKGLLQWLINHMEKVEFTASTFHLECMTDLLRMLMDVENATELSQVNIPQLIVVLVRYMNVENEYVKINVCHSLRTLFRDGTAIRIGNKIHLHRIIQDHLQRTTNSKLKEDLEFIYKLFVDYRIHESSKHGSSSSRVDDRDRDNNDHKSHSTCPERNKMISKYYSEPDVHTKNDESLKTQNMVSASENPVRSELAKLSEKLRQDLLADISSYILQICLNEEKEDYRPSREKSKVENSETEYYTTDDSFESVETESTTSNTTLCKKNKGDQQKVNIDEISTPDIIYTNLNWKIDHNSSSLNSNSLSSHAQEEASKKTKEKGITKSVDVDMEDTNKIGTTTSGCQLEKSKLRTMKLSEKSIDFSDFNSIAKDPNARNELLENDSFIEELCEKVMNKLRTKFFCGPNCNTNNSCEKKTDDAN